EPIAGLGVSNTIRWAVAGWAKTLARELAPAGITVNNVLPGYTATGRLDSLFAARAAKTGATATQISAHTRAGRPIRRVAPPRHSHPDCGTSPRRCAHGPLRHAGRNRRRDCVPRQPGGGVHHRHQPAGGRRPTQQFVNMLNLHHYINGELRPSATDRWLDNYE